MQSRERYFEAWRRTGQLLEQPLIEALRQGIRAQPEQKLYFYSDEHPGEIHFATAEAEISRLAAGLYQLGLRPGDMVVGQIPHWREGVLLLLACISLGLVYVPVVHILGPAELSYILRSTGAKLLVVPDRWRKIDYASRVAALADVPDLQHVAVIGSGEFPWQVLRFADLQSAKGDAPVVPGTPATICAIIFTSGTTAAPKGVQHTQQSLFAECVGLADAMGAQGRRMSLVGLPAGHIGGLTSSLRCFILGGSSVFMDAWNPARAAEAVLQHGAGYCSGPPILLLGLMDALGDRGPGAMTQWMLGSTSISPEIVRRADAFGIHAFRCYGSSELPTITSGYKDDPFEKRAFTDGDTMLACEVRIESDEGEILPIGAQGEVVVMGPELFHAYLDPAHNHASFTADGWFRTGDIGVLDAQGFLTIVDRKKDIIIRGGENISSKEVEDVLMRLPQVEEAACIGKPDEAMGERVCAFIRLRPGGSLDLPTVQAHFAAAGVARQKTPEQIVVVEDLPRTPSGKVMKPELRRRLREAGEGSRT